MRTEYKEQKCLTERQSEKTNGFLLFRVYDHNRGGNENFKIGNDYNLESTCASKSYTAPTDNICGQWTIRKHFEISHVGG